MLPVVINNIIAATYIPHKYKALKNMLTCIVIQQKAIRSVDLFSSHLAQTPLVQLFVVCCTLQQHNKHMTA